MSAPVTVDGVDAVVTADTKSSRRRDNMIGIGVIVVVLLGLGWYLHSKSNGSSASLHHQIANSTIETDLDL